MENLAQSSPYGILITNGNPTSYSVNVFGAWNNLQNGVFSNGVLYPASPNKNLTIEGAFSNVTYQYLLNQSVVAPFNVGTTQLYCVTNNSQATQPMTLTTTDANGDSQSRNIVWLLNPFQNQSGTLISENSFRVDGSTTLTMTVLPNSAFYMYFFPSGNVDPARPLVGAPIDTKFANPDLTPASTVVIQHR
jgi:hypothetical protein